MKFLVLAALLALVAAQASPATPTAGPGQHIIEVGQNNGFMFTPSTTTALQNETVTFVFNEFTSGAIVMHSVTQSTFANPCTLAPGGFDSGFQPSNNQFTITITNASQPIWFFCQQFNPLKHCNLGMVGGINVPTTGPNAISNFVLAASTASVPMQTASGILTGIGAVATAPAAPAANGSSSGSAGSSSSGGSSPSASASASATPSSAMRLVAGAGSLLAGLFAVVYTLA